MTPSVLESNLFDGIAGLPLHPLVVHLAVVLLPLSALGLILLAFVPRLRPKLATVTVLGTLVGAAATFVAKESGEALERHVGDPGIHAEYGDWAFFGAAALAALSVIWWLMQWRAQKRDSQGAATVIVSVLTALASVVAIGLMVLVGHSGAEQVWKGTLTSTAAEGGDQGEGDEGTPSTTPSASETSFATSSATETSSASSSADAAAAPTTSSGYTLSVVAQHDKQTDCWAAIDGKVYDLTSWISRHPGGAQRILDICGKDGSAAFDAQHGGESRPAAELAQFLKGDLAQ